MKVSIVVLHYLTSNDTIECIDSLLLLKQSLNTNDQLDVVIVDNKSPNNSVKILQDKYNNISNIHFILLDENLGFAKGNNKGYMYAKENLSPDYIVLLNNDTKIEQLDFINKIKLIDEEMHFDILGPKIISLVDGLNQNPVPYALKSTFSITKRLIKFILNYLLSFFDFDLYLTKNDKNKAINFNSMESYQLFGCCLIFSKNYINEFDGLYSKTFMYIEEDILKFRCEKYNLKMIYDDRICIFHKEGSSTNSLYSKGRNRRQFYYKNTIASLLKLLLMKLGIEEI